MFHMKGEHVVYKVVLFEAFKREQLPLAEKYEGFVTACFDRPEIYDYLCVQGLELPEDPEMMLAPGGFFNSFNEDQAKAFFGLLAKNAW
jgi:hypothetical protein